jgi:hypothetical protein
MILCSAAVAKAFISAHPATQFGKQPLAALDQKVKAMLLVAANVVLVAAHEFALRSRVSSSICFCHGLVKV